MSSNHSHPNRGADGKNPKKYQNIFDSLQMSTASTDPDEDGGVPLHSGDNEDVDRATILARRQALVTGVYVDPNNNNNNSSAGGQQQSEAAPKENGLAYDSEAVVDDTDEDGNTETDDQNTEDEGPIQQYNKSATSFDSTTKSSPEHQSMSQNVGLGLSVPPNVNAQINGLQAGPNAGMIPVAMNQGNQFPVAAGPYGMNGHQQFVQPHGAPQAQAGVQGFAAQYPQYQGGFPHPGHFAEPQGMASPPFMPFPGYPMNFPGYGAQFQPNQGQVYQNPSQPTQGQVYQNPNQPGMVNGDGPNSTLYTPVAGIPGSQTSPVIGRNQQQQTNDADGFKVVGSRKKGSKKKASNASSSPLKENSSIEGLPRSVSSPDLIYYDRQVSLEVGDVTPFFLDNSGADKEDDTHGAATGPPPPPGGSPTAQESETLSAVSFSRRADSPTLGVWDEQHNSESQDNSGRTAMNGPGSRKLPPILAMGLNALPQPAEDSNSSHSDVRAQPRQHTVYKAMMASLNANQNQSSAMPNMDVVASAQNGGYPAGGIGKGLYVPPHQRQPVPENQLNYDMQALTLASPGALVSNTGDCPVPAEIRAKRSAHLNAITKTPTSRPSVEVAFDPQNFPFMESCKRAEPKNHGVVRIRNIPFATQRAEIIAFLGRNSKILNDSEEPVHIIMERVTAKTQDAYIEFYTLQDAMKAVHRHQEILQKGRPARLGDRPVEVELSSQDALMRDLFPLATAVKWQNGRPVIVPKTHNEPWGDFHGFVTAEEMAMLVKHVEVPQRTAYSRQCPQRPFECMISTIKKLPWYVSEHIKLEQRNAIYNSTEQLVQLLIASLKNNPNSSVLTRQLKKRLVDAALACPGFSVLQKDNIAFLDDRDDIGAWRLFDQPRMANCWTHQWTLCAKPDLPNDVIEWYIAIIREETIARVQSLPIMDSQAVQVKGQNVNGDGFWGFYWWELSQPVGSLPSGKDFDSMSLHEIAKHEMHTIEQILRRAFSRYVPFTL